MLFPTHLLVGYVLGRRWDLPAVWVVVGAALPDVVDKSLASAGVFELYHTVGHSLAALVVGGAALLAGGNLAGRNGTLGNVADRIGPALWAGWASHLVLDAVHMIVNGRPADVQFLAWPAVHHVPAVHLPPVEFAFHYLWTPSFFLEVAIWLGVAGGMIYERATGTRTP